MEQPTNLISNPIVGNDEIPYPNWLELPTEVTSTILQKIGTYNILNTAQFVCTSWFNICTDPSMWKTIDLYCSEGDHDYMSDAEDIAFQAVNRSSGQLLHISMSFFPSDDFIHHLAQYAGQLRSLQIYCCHGLTDDVLEETADKFPHLEELEVQSTLFSKAAIEAVGRSCPLRSLKFNFLGISPQKGASDAVATIIADTMPQLRHLQLIGNRMTNDGLKVILNKCLSLESLDIRSNRFSGVIDESLAEICSKQIKNVRYPGDDIGEYEFGEEPVDIPEDCRSFESYDYLDHLQGIRRYIHDRHLFIDGDGYLVYDDSEVEDNWLQWV